MDVRLHQVSFRPGLVIYPFIIRPSFISQRVIGNVTFLILCLSLFDKLEFIVVGIECMKCDCTSLFVCFSEWLLLCCSQVSSTLNDLDSFLKRIEPGIEAITGEEQDIASFMRLMRVFNEVKLLSE